ncbi:Hypothetical_protein [Hexamita inflata]|uniref:Hypothetical_protein n=1 Tax=Hexamita inflata TaxID=28002 RepID=A0ABP1JU65_9EUKA
MRFQSCPTSTARDTEDSSRKTIYLIWLQRWRQQYFRKLLISGIQLAVAEQRYPNRIILKISWVSPDLKILNAVPELSYFNSQRHRRQLLKHNILDLAATLEIIIFSEIIIFWNPAGRDRDIQTELF